jgi:hypothetical protein
MIDLFKQPREVRLASAARDDDIYRGNDMTYRLKQACEHTARPT